MLLLHGADPNSQNGKGFTALHVAAEKIDSIGYKKHGSYSNYVRVLEVLLQSNAHNDIRSSNGTMPTDLIHDKSNFDIW